jgi:hypothetical protein
LAEGEEAELAVVRIPIRGSLAGWASTASGAARRLPTIVLRNMRRSIT